MELLSELENVLDRIPPDFGGGSPLEKVFLMSHLAASRRLKVYVEIGVYRGRSLLPVATAMRLQGGRAFGIDPYTRENAYENDLAPNLMLLVREWIAKTDFDQLYRDVTALVPALGLESTVEILRTPSDQAATYFQDHGITIDMLHVDGNHDTKFVMRDVELYLPLVAPGGIVVMDDINWDSVKPAYEKLQERMTVLFEAPSYSFLINRQDGEDLSELKQGLALMHDALLLRSSAIRVSRPPVAPATASPPKVSVSLTTYNQECFIATAIESVLAQKTNFPFEIVIADDCSTDRTREICQDYQRLFPGLIRMLDREKNLGAVPNYLETFKACRGEYVAFLEGDDYWLDPDKLQKQVEFLDSHRDYVICCHNVLIVDADGTTRGKLLRNVQATTMIKDLCRGDYIATASCMVRNHLLDELPSWLYALPGCDWALDILHAEKGKIGYHPEAMAAYRIHQGGIFSGCSRIAKLHQALQVAQAINRHLEYRHAKAFQFYEQLVRHEIKALEALPAQGPQGTAEQPGVNGSNATNETLVLEYEALMRANDVLVLEYDTALFELDKARSLNKAGKRELRAAKRSLQEVKTKYKQAVRTIASAEAWQRRSWFTRVLHKWRPGNKHKLSKKPPEVSGQFTNVPATVSSSPKHGEVVSQLALLPSPPKGSAVTEKLNLVILDDIFPHPLSAFRFEEYIRYLESIPDTMVYSTAAAFGCLHEKRTLEQIITEAEERHPSIKGRICRFNPDSPLNAKLAYVVFLGNIAGFLSGLEASHIPFVFTLYPGGSFELNDPAKNRLMRRVFSSKWFRKVIVTQNITREYLLEHDLCAPDQIAYIQGGVTPSEHLHRDLSGKEHYGFGKSRLDICFVAHRYSTDGVDKGYDFFIGVARRLASRYDNIFFHVVGGFDESVIDVSDLSSRISFYGRQEPAWFETFYQDKDIILSPNIPFKLAPGAFDGFPTGCCTDAALHAVAMFCTDVLGLNENFTDGKDIVLIPYNVERITKLIEHYHQNPTELRSLALKGCETSRYLCGYEYQMVPRLRLLQQLIQEDSHV